MIHTYAVEGKEYEELSLQARFHADMIAEMAEVKFADKVIDIIVNRYPFGKAMERMTDDEKSRIESMLGIREAGFNAYHALLKIYESEFGKIEEVHRKNIDTIADAASDTKLYMNHWITDGEYEELVEKWKTLEPETDEPSAKLTKAKEIVEEYFGSADCGIFDSRNIVGDTMENIYKGDGLTIDICYGYAYFEVFGLSNKEFAELKEFYNVLKEKEWEE